MIQLSDRTVPLTDAGNAQLFVERCGANLRWVPEWKTWLKYDGTRWARVAPEALIPWAIDVARGFYLQAASEPDADKRSKLVAHAKKMEDRSRLDAMISIARGFLLVVEKTLDANPRLLNTPTATIDLQTFEARDHRREDMITMITNAPLVLGATCPRFDAFVDWMFPDRDVRDWVQRFAGYCLTGSVREQIMTFFHGGGDNGKSTLIETWHHVLGDYAYAGAPGLIQANDRNNGEDLARRQRAKLKGKRFVSIQEIEAGRYMNESQAKQLTGGDKVNAQEIYQSEENFDASHKIAIATNHKLVVRGTDHGIWRRVRLVPFTSKISDDAKDLDLPAKLQAEASGILNWMLLGCYAWQSKNLGTKHLPKAMSDATAKYRKAEDRLGAFLDEHTEPGESESGKALYDRFRAWATEHGENQWSRRAFTNALEERGFTAERFYVGKTQMRGVRGLKLRSLIPVSVPPTSAPALVSVVETAVN